MVLYSWTRDSGSIHRLVGRDPAVSQRQFYVEIQAIHDSQNIAY